jgi:hypothetical protein
MEKQTKRGPLLYISQPFSNQPANNMQEIFSNRQERQLPIEEPSHVEEVKKKKGFEVSLAKTEKPKETKMMEIKKDTISDKKHDSHLKFNRVKGFKEMNLQERLEYLANFPKVLPPVPCVFYTEEENYQGYLLEYNDNELKIQFPNQSIEIIPVNDLKDIMMIGIRR